jgi:hypothetical protein
LLSLACIEFVFAGIATGAEVATIVYSQDLKDPFTGYGSNDPATSSAGQQIADDFSLGSAAKLNRVTWYGYYTDLHGTSYGGTSSQFSTRFFADDGNGLAPVNAPPFFSESVTVDAAPTGVVTTGDNHAVFSYSATLSSVVSLTAGTFWLSIVEDDAGTDDTWEWADTLLGVGTPINVRKIPGSLDDWTPVSLGSLRTQRAFILANDPLTSVAVPIDIKPGSFPNSINPQSKGVIPVAILTTDTFDATTVDPCVSLLPVLIYPEGQNIILM